MFGIWHLEVSFRDLHRVMQRCALNNGCLRSSNAYSSWLKMTIKTWYLTLTAKVSMECHWSSRQVLQQTLLLLSYLVHAWYIFCTVLWQGSELLPTMNVLTYCTINIKLLFGTHLFAARPPKLRIWNSIYGHTRHILTSSQLMSSRLMLETKRHKRGAQLSPHPPSIALSLQQPSSWRTLSTPNSTTFSACLRPPRTMNSGGRS